MNIGEATRGGNASGGYSLQGFSNSNFIKPPFAASGNKIEALLSRLDKVKPNGNGKWQALCPAHPDKSPSLGVKLTDDGKILIHCFAGCHVRDIVDAMGIQLLDLMPDDTTYTKNIKPPRFNRHELFDLVAYESIILSLAIRQLLNYEDLNQADLSRVVLAEETINRIVMEVRR